MRVVGVIAEYNPLHNGHIYHLEQAKRKTGASYCVVIMSGNFVQRGEPACTDKFTRAEWALQAGADLVIELPTVFANASAERFAEGAVRLLHATGLVTDLAFGAEQGDIGKLSQLNGSQRGPSAFSTPRGWSRTWPSARSRGTSASSARWPTIWQRSRRNSSPIFSIT